MRGFTAGSVPLGAAAARAARADVVIEGLEQAGPSFGGHVFLDNPSATLQTPRDAEHGYAGSFSVFGQGGGSAGARPADAGGGAVAPITKEVIATGAVRAAAERGADAVSVTIVPEPRGAAAPAPLSPSRIAIVVR